jgi:hypothetical protein
VAEGGGLLMRFSPSPIVPDNPGTSAFLPLPVHLRGAFVPSDPAL